jgi:hypothetical protein
MKALCILWILLLPSITCIFPITGRMAQHFGVTVISYGHGNVSSLRSLHQDKLGNGILVSTP